MINHFYFPLFIIYIGLKPLFYYLTIPLLKDHFKAVIQFITSPSTVVQLIIFTAAATGQSFQADRAVGVGNWGPCESGRPKAGRL